MLVGQLPHLEVGYLYARERGMERLWNEQTESELKTLFSHGLPDDQIAIKLRTTDKAIAAKRLRLGILRTGPSKWTPERIEIVKTRTAQGYSARLIAEELGFTKNSVMSKQDQLGLIRSKIPLVAHARKAPTFKPKGPPLPPPVDQFVALKIPFMQLKEFHCQWILDERGDDGLATFCGHPKFGCSSWCSHHFRKVSQGVV